LFNFFGGSFQTFTQEALLFLPRLIVAIITFVATLLLSGAAARWAYQNTKKAIEDEETRRLLAKIVRWGVVIVGTILALEQVNFDVTSFVAGLGIAGVTVGFALQDIARNFVSGILLLVRQPFNIGDAVEVAGHAGTVKEITTRDTVIETWDGVMEIIPNIDVFTNPIVNYSELPLRRRTVTIGLGYGQDVEQAKQIFLQAIRNVEGVQDEPAPEILAEGLGDSAMTLAARFWVNQETHNLFETHSRAVQAINDTAEREGIDLPYPTQTLRLEGDWPIEAA
jgi:small-conductance mechanosensitive channel